MKYLIFVLLLITPSFAIPPAKEARANAKKVSAKVIKDQLPSLLNKIDTSIRKASKEGNYEVSIDIKGFDFMTIQTAINILAEHGYSISPFYKISNNEVLVVEW